MQIKSIEIFIEVVKTGSFSEAARQLNTVQSNITNHIKKLEDQLKVQLLQRNSPVVPTRAGLQLLQYAEQMINIKNEILTAFGHTQANNLSPLKIGSMETTAATRLPAFLNYLQNLQPDLPFQLYTDASRHLIDRIEQHELDCAFIANQAPIPDLYNLLIWTENLVLVTGLNHTNELSSSWLRKQNFIAFKQGCTYRKSIDLLISELKLPAVKITEMGSLDAIMSCVSLNMGVALLPVSYIQRSANIDKVQLLQIPSHLSEINTYLIARNENEWSSNMHLFQKAISNYLDSQLCKEMV